MSTDETKQVMDDYLAALVSGGDFSAFFADDVRWTTMETGDVISGREAVRDFIVAFHHRSFDASPELRQLVCSDDVAGLEATFIGTHIADFAGVPATGAEVRVPYSMFYDIEDGKIAALRAYLPITSMIEEVKTQGASLAR